MIVITLSRRTDGLSVSFSTSHKVDRGVVARQSSIIQVPQELETDTIVRAIRKALTYIDVNSDIDHTTSI